MKQKTAPLDEVLLRMRRVDSSLLSRDIHSAMESAVELHPSHDLKSKYKETPAVERCTLLLEGYAAMLRELGKGDSAVLQAYDDFATVIGHHPSIEPAEITPHYLTWNSVLDAYQKQHGLEKASWLE